MSSTPVVISSELDPPSNEELVALSEKTVRPLTGSTPVELLRGQAIDEDMMLARMLGPDGDAALARLRQAALQNTPQADKVRDFLRNYFAGEKAASVVAFVPPSEYTMAIIHQMPSEELKRLMKIPTERVKIDAVVATANARLGEKIEAVADVIPESKVLEEINVPVAQTPEEVARIAAEAETVRIAQEEATRVAEEARIAQEAETARVAEVARIAAEEFAKPKEIVREYQVKDEHGQPIGKPTKIVATSWEDLAEKMQAVHENAMRYAERIKNRKPTQAPPPEPIPLTDEQLLAVQKDLESVNPATRAAAIAKIAGDQVIKDNQVMRRQLQEAENGRQARVFLAANPDYFYCAANNRLIDGYIIERKLAYTADNLEIAYEAVLNQLAEKPKPVSPPVVEPGLTPNPMPVAVATISTTAVPVQVQAIPAPVPTPVASASAAVAPSVVPVATNPVPAAQPPITGVQPGELTGSSPANPTAMTAPVKRWTSKMLYALPNEELKRRMKNPDFAKRVNADLELERAARR